MQPAFKDQRGVTLVESIVSLGILSAVLAGTAYLSNQQAADTRLSGASTHLRIISDATRQYVRHNRALLINHASPTDAAIVPVSQLIADGYLPAGFSARNIFDQHICALVLEPEPGQLNTLIVGEGGVPLDDISLAHLSAQLGAGGGGHFSQYSSTLMGAGGAWSIPLASYHNLPNHLGVRCDGTAGRVQIGQGAPVYALWMDSVDGADPGYLFRDRVPGAPDVNTMGANIDMGGNRINGLKPVSIGASCGVDVPNGDLASGPRGEVVSCVDGVWIAVGIPYWGLPSPSYGSLPACNASNMGETREVTDINGVFVCTGIRWDVAINANGDFALPDHLRVADQARVGGNLTVNGKATVSGSATFNDVINAYGRIDAASGIEMGANQSIKGLGDLDVEAEDNLYLNPNAGSGPVIIGGSGGNGNLTAKGFIQSDKNIVSGKTLSTEEFVEVGKIITEGASCNPNGLLGRDAAGSVLACEGGVWRKHGMRPFYAVKFSGPINNDGWTYRGYTPTTEWHWCKDFNINVGTGGFVVFSLYNRLTCSSAYKDCFTGAVISKPTNPQLSLTTQHLVYPDSGEDSETSTYYNEFTSGSTRYTMCVLASWASGFKPSNPNIAYSITAFKK